MVNGIYLILTRILIIRLSCFSWSTIVQFGAMIILSSTLLTKLDMFHRAIRLKSTVTARTLNQMSLIYFSSFLVKIFEELWIYFCQLWNWCLWWFWNLWTVNRWNLPVQNFAFYSA